MRGRRVLRETLGAGHAVEGQRDQLRIAVLEDRFEIGEDRLLAVEELGGVPGRRLNPSRQAPMPPRLRGRSPLLPRAVSYVGP